MWTPISTLFYKVLETKFQAIKSKFLCMKANDAVGRFVTNVVMGTFEAGQQLKKCLLISQVLDKPNSSTITFLFTNLLALLWPEGVKHKNVLLFVTDASPYMKKAGRDL